MSIRQLANGEASADLFTCSPALLFPASGSFTPVVWPEHSAVLRRLRTCSVLVLDNAIGARGNCGWIPAERPKENIQGGC